MKPLYYLLLIPILSITCQAQMPENQTMPENKATLIYVGDPMCSWCWGIAKELNQLKIHFEKQLDFELIVGGLRPGGGEEWNETFKNFLKEHWEHVGQSSGQPFNFSLLEQGHFNYDTEPACRAVRIVRDMAPEQEFSFFKKIQERFYVGNEDPTTVLFYKAICEALDIPFETFSVHFASSGYREKTAADFRKAHELGVTGFPTILLKKGTEVFPIAYGFSSFEKMKTRIDQIITTN